jgi:enoyl-CoA hydratase
MSEMQHVQVRREGPVVVATLVNPPRNLMNARMVQEMHALVDEIADDEAVRALIVTGGAVGIFITHYDVGELSRISDVVRERPAPAERAASAGPAPLHPLNALSMKLRALPQPVIAAINGTAMGGGCELTLACDFRIMAKGFQLGLPEVRVGILPGAGGTQRMSRLLGTAKALELMLLGNTVDADTAEKLGLVHRAVAPERVIAEALALANELASRPRTSIAEIKRCVYEGIELPIEDALRFEQEAFNRTMRSDDASRLMRAYLSSERPLNEQ